MSNTSIQNANDLVTSCSATDWIIAIASMITAFTIIVFVGQLLTMKSQLDTMIKSLMADHERSRREKAISLMEHYNSQVLNMPSILNILSVISDLSESQCKDIVTGKSINIDSKHLHNLSAFLKEELICSNEIISLSETHSNI